jgi:dual specificity MAP kinase phosphatase
MDARTSSNNKGKPWDTISAAEFAAMHRAHALAHAPDGVLFPFLQGLEGDNVAQNTFFSSGGA